jgi:hypothetical protein
MLSGLACLNARLAFGSAARAVRRARRIVVLEDCRRC